MQAARSRKYRGKRWELELVDILKDHGWNSLRYAMSGQGRHAPDVLGLKEDVIAVFECKSSHTGVARLRRLQVEKLRQTVEFYKRLKDIKLVAVLACKFPYRDRVFRLLTLEDLEENHKIIEEKLSILKGRLESGGLSEELYRDYVKSLWQEPFLAVRPTTKSNWQP